GADKITPAKLLEIEVVVCCRSPKPECIDGLAAVAHHGTIVWNADQTTRTTNHRAQCPSTDLERAVKLDLHGLVRTRHFPRVRAAEPVIRLLVLPAVLNRLFEDPVLISQAVPHGRNLHRGHGVDKASRQPPQPAVAQ